jgi:hypothetical protein
MKFKNYEIVQFNNNINNEKINYPEKDFSDRIFTFIKICYILLSIIIIIIIFKKMNNKFYEKESFVENKNTENYLENYLDLDKYEINIYNNINNKDLLRCSRMWGNQKEFVNGVVRKFKPKKY